MSGFEHFLHMGGYAYYVWSAYGIAAVILFGNVFAARKQQKQVMKRLRRAQELKKEQE